MAVVIFRFSQQGHVLGAAVKDEAIQLEGHMMIQYPGAFLLELRQLHSLRLEQVASQPVGQQGAEKQHQEEGGTEQPQRNP